MAWPCSARTSLVMLPSGPGSPPDGGAFGGAEVEQAQGLLLGRVGADALGAAGDAVAVLGVEETTSGPVRPRRRRRC